MERWCNWNNWYIQLKKFGYFAFLSTVFKVYVALSIQWCRAEGESAPPKVLICRKFGRNSWKVGYRGFDTFVYYWVIWLFSPKKTTFLVQCKCAHSWAWKIQLSLSSKCSMVWSWAKTNKGIARWIQVITFIICRSTKLSLCLAVCECK